MSILNDKEHFIHKKVKIEAYGKGNYFDLLSNFRIPTSKPGEKSDDNSVVAWQQMESHFQFFYDYIGCELEIFHWLQQSKLKDESYLLTYFHSPEEIVKVQIEDFIQHWDELNKAVQYQEMVYISKNGQLVLEFTDDYKHQLNSNFLIKRP